MEYEYIVIGAGLSGLVFAERIANVLHKKVLLIEKRVHIGGNCYDVKDEENGILIHRYGPHLFHTDNETVYKYLSEFTEWLPYKHKVLAFVDGKNVVLPFSFYSIDQLFNKAHARLLKNKLSEVYGIGARVPILQLLSHKEKVLRDFGNFVYKKVFVNYTAKQWGKKPEEIDSEVTARVPVIVGYENHYFMDRYQGVPLQGYTKLFAQMVDQPNIKVCLNTDAMDMIGIVNNQLYFDGTLFKGKMIYTGEIDALFDYRYGILPYRSLNLEFETIPLPWYQENSVINYPNEYDFTRITEFKHIHKVSSQQTIILKEYPEPYIKGENLPYYPMLTDKNRMLYNKYYEMVKAIPNLYAVGRLAEYRYYDMDDVVARALEIFYQEFQNEK